jgi:hypothetical protein
MASRKDTASKRLFKFFACEGRHAAPSLLSLLNPDQKEQKQIDWSQPSRRAVGADIALTLTDSPFDEPIRKAFQACDLDPLDPFNWRRLLFYFAHAHFGKRERGRKSQWNTQKWCQLLSDFNRIRERNPDRSEEKICGDLLKDQALGARYRKMNQSKATLRRNLQYARDPRRNELIEHFSVSWFPETLRLVHQICEEKSVATDAAVADRLADKIAVRWAIEYVSRGWKGGNR